MGSVNPTGLPLHLFRELRLTAESARDLLSSTCAASERVRDSHRRRARLQSRCDALGSPSTDSEAVAGLFLWSLGREARERASPSRDGTAGHRSRTALTTGSVSLPKLRVQLPRLPWGRSGRPKGSDWDSGGRGGRPPKRPCDTHGNRRVEGTSLICRRQRRVGEGICTEARHMAHRRYKKRPDHGYEPTLAETMGVKWESFDLTIIEPEEREGIERAKREVQRKRDRQARSEAETWFKVPRRGL